MSMKAPLLISREQTINSTSSEVTVTVYITAEAEPEGKQLSGTDKIVGGVVALVLTLGVASSAAAMIDSSVCSRRLLHTECAARGGRTVQKEINCPTGSYHQRMIGKPLPSSCVKVKLLCCNTHLTLCSNHHKRQSLPYSTLPYSTLPNQPTNQPIITNPTPSTQLFPSYKRPLGSFINSLSASSVSAAPFKIAAYIKNTATGKPMAVMAAVIPNPSLGVPPVSSKSDPLFCFVLFVE